MDELQKLWAEHSGAGFPRGLGGTEVEGIDLTALDADIAGCVDTYLKNGGSLDAKRQAVLEVSYQDAAKVALGLTGEQRRYFERLRDLAQKTLRALPDQRGGGLTSA